MGFYVILFFKVVNIVEYYSIGKFSKLIGVTTQSLRNWDKIGRLRPHHISKSGYRYYSQEQLYCYLGINGENPKNKKVIGYCRVSSNKQKDDLERQIENVKTYMYAKEYLKNKKGGRYVKTSNIIKLEKQIKKLYRKLDNIRTDYRQKVTTRIVKTKPSRIVMESLNVSGMMKNRYLSRDIANQGFYEFKKNDSL
jgi:predicted site-specific integrase-resolvase